MKKNGFTLIELIAAVGIMLMLSTIVIPIVVRKINETKEKSYNVLINSIELAAHDYVLNNADNITSFKTNDWTYVTIETLIENKYFNESLIDARTKEAIPITNEVYVTRLHNGNINAHYDDNQSEKAKILLNGSYNIYLKKGDTYTELGVTATDTTGTDVTSSVVKTGNLITTITGVYIFTYTYQDSSITRNIVVK